MRAVNLNELEKFEASDATNIGTMLLCGPCLPIAVELVQLTSRGAETDAFFSLRTTDDGSIATHKVQRKETSVHRVDWHMAFQIKLTPVERRE
jgi:hypothetical protein